MHNLNYLNYYFSKSFKSWKNKYLKYITQKEAKEQDLYNKIVKEISEYTDDPLEVVKQKHKLGPESEKDFGVFKNQSTLSDLAVENFYKNCSYYIYELPLWNAERNRPRYLYLICSAYLKKNKYKKVLDFGAGAGDFCIELAQKDLDITYCDIGGKLYDFAKWRFEKRNLYIKMVNGLDKLGTEEFDCIFSFDTFEHVKNLPEILRKLVNHIRPSGSLIFSGAFSGGTLHLEENEKFNEFKQLDALMQNSGLVFQDKFSQFYFYKK